MSSSAPKQETEMKLKLLVDMKAKKVVFGEASKDFVDFLFGLLQIPFGTLIAILQHVNANSSTTTTTCYSSSSSSSSIYQSVQNLDSTYFQSAQGQESLLKPKSTLSANDTNTPPMLTHILTKHVCEKYAVSASKKEEGFVKGVVTYMVMDNLEVKPMSAISSISLINSLQVKDVRMLAELTVKVDHNKALELIKAMLCQDREAVLTHVFFPKQAFVPIPVVSPAV